MLLWLYDYYGFDFSSMILLELLLVLFWRIDYVVEE